MCIASAYKASRHVQMQCQPDRLDASSAMADNTATFHEKDNIRAHQANREKRYD